MAKLQLDHRYVAMCDDREDSEDPVFLEGPGYFEWYDQGGDANHRAMSFELCLDHTSHNEGQLAVVGASDEDVVNSMSILTKSCEGKQFHFKEVYIACVHCDEDGNIYISGTGILVK